MSDRRSNFGFSRVKKIKHSRATVHFFEEESIQKNKFKPAFIIFMSLINERLPKPLQPEDSSLMSDEINSPVECLYDQILVITNIALRV